MDVSYALDDQLEELVNSTPTVVHFDPNDQTVQALISDLAMGMRNYEIIAARYGLTLEQLYEFIKIPEVRRRVKTKKAIWESDDNQAERIKRYYGALTLEAAPMMDQLLHNPTTPPQHLLKGIEVAARLGGADNKGAGETGGVIADRFSVVFQFSGAASERFTVMNEPTPPQITIEGDPA